MMKKYPGLTILIVALLLRMAVGVFATDSPASAAAQNCAAKDEHLYGALHIRPQQLDTTGVLSDIDVRRSDLCANTNHPTASAAWSMLEDAGGEGWAQIGYAVRSSCNDCRTFFWQLRKGPNAQIKDDFFGSPGTGVTKRFKVTWQNGSGADNRIHLYICDNGGGNCVQHRETNWNPTSAGWPGQVGAWSGETWDKQNDMPGTDGNRANFNNIQVRTDAGPWHAPTSLTKCLQGPSGGCNEPVNAYHFNWINSNADAHFKIWTDPINR